MGVRFECPNGHKLNVKADLAGKRGICPECQARFIVPEESGGRVALVEVSVASSGESVRLPPPAVETAAPGATGSTAADESSLRAPADAWYVRPATGGQFGPATTAQFRQWIAEGRVPDDSWVWRDGWPDWKGASDVLAEFATGRSSTISAPIPSGSQPTPSASVVAGPETADPAAPPESASAISHRAKIARRKRRNRQVTIVLAVVVAVLMAVLAIVLLR